MERQEPVRCMGYKQELYILTPTVVRVYSKTHMLMDADCT